MIRVTIEMLPLGNESRKRHLGTVTIANDGTGTRGLGNYKVRLSRRGKPDSTWRTACLTGFRRLSRGPYELLLLALVAALGDRIFINNRK
ncbi:MAG: hypothetical protein AB1560_01885 [Pseudomonadota bacterium]